MIKVGVVTFFILSICMVGRAQSGKIQPVSISYQKLRECFPEIQDDKLSFKVDLNRLKELIDTRFVSTQSQMRMRKVHYQDTERQTKNLILRTKNISKNKAETLLVLQVVDKSGVLTDVALTRNQSLNPKPDMINGFLNGAKILSDESWHNDTKLKNMSATYKMNFKNIEEYELRDPLVQRTLNCNVQPDLGIICMCSKK